ncbi:MAG: ABC transporter ATP-binding protein, partial [Clostridia bacterium]|nr:ABC transporter ATP-binding protein [Clostridia bacterium]
YVTHDQTEAMTMADRIVVMKDGFIQQVDSPTNLYNKPVNVFVAGFIGTPQMNFINATLDQIGDDLYIKFEGNKLRLPPEKALNPSIKDYIGKEVIAGVRPECLFDDPELVATLPDASVEAFVEVTELMGSEIYLYLLAGEQPLVARVSARSTARTGDTIKVAFDTGRIHIFDKDTERCIMH